LLLLIFTMGETTNVGWGSWRTISGIVGSVVLLAAFLLIEARVNNPMIPLRVFRLKTMRTANLAAVLVFGMFSAMFFFVSIFMQQVYGYSPIQAGLAYLPLGVCVVIGAGIASGLITKMAARPVLIAGLLITLVGLLLLWGTPVGGNYVLGLLPALLALGLGCGICYVTLQIAAFVGISDEEAGVGAGLINTSQSAGGALGLAVIATIAYSGLSSALAEAGNNPVLIQAAQTTANHNAFLACACFGVISLLLAFLMPRERRTSSMPPQTAQPPTQALPIPVGSDNASKTN
jgi:predicted MFS family arabinose efflux permease